MEWKLFTGDVPYVSTFDYHKDRDRAPHAEQNEHRPRMQLALDYVRLCKPQTVWDLGCGDGGFVAMIKKELPEARPMGFDFCPATENGWQERGVADLCQQRNVFPSPPWPVIDPTIEAALHAVDLAVMTEILEHLARPHEALASIRSNHIVVSSPWGENDRNHDESHAWAWDMNGYRQLVTGAGFDILDHRQAGFSQVILARRRNDV